MLSNARDRYPRRSTRRGYREEELSDEDEYLCKCLGFQNIVQNRNGTVYVIFLTNSRKHNLVNGIHVMPFSMCTTGTLYYVEVFVCIWGSAIQLGVCLPQSNLIIWTGDPDCILYT